MAGSFVGAAAAMVSLGAAVRTISEFDRSMSQVQAITRATTDELERLRDTASGLGSTTEFTASQAAGGLRFLGMAGFTATESISAIPAVLDLATSASMDLAQAADTASNIMSAFGIAAEDAADVSDVLAAASSRANTDVSQLGSAMSFVGPVAAAMGVDLGEAAAAVGVLSDAGIQGSAAGTGLRRVLSSLANPTSQAAAALHSLGVTLEEVDPATTSVVDIVDRLAASGISAADALTIFGDRGGPAILALTSQAGRLSELTEELSNVEGEASRMAGTIRDNLSGDLDSLWSSVQGLVIALGDAGLTAVLRATVRGITGVVRATSELVDLFGSLISFVGRAGPRVFGFSRSTVALSEASYAAAAGINQEIAKIDALTGTLTQGRTMSIDVAGVKLAQARAHLASADAQRQELESSIRASDQFQRLANEQVAAFSEVQRMQARINEAGDRASQRQINDYRAMIERLRGNVEMQNRLLAVAGETDDEYRAALRTIELIETALETATGAAITLGEPVEEATETASRLSSEILGVDFGPAISGARDLANELGISLHRAMQMMGLIGRAAQASQTPIYDPRDPRFDREAAEQGARMERLTEIMADLRQETEEATSATDDLASSSGRASSALSETSKQLSKSEQAAADFAEEMRGNMSRSVDRVSDAFSDWMRRGFRDVRSFTQAVLGEFRDMFISITMLALRNRIVMPAVGFAGGGATGAVAQVVDGKGGGLGNLASGQGLLGGFLGSFGNTGSILGFGGLGGGTGLLGGLGNALSGGLGNVFNIGANAAGLGFAGTIGAAIPVLGAVAAAFSFFRKRTKELDAGLSVTIDNMDTFVQEFRVVQTKRFWGLSKKVRTHLTDADEETTTAITGMVDTLRDGVYSAADALGFASSTFDGFAHTMRISTRGLSEEDAESAVTKALTGAADAMADMIPGLTGFARVGETASETLERLANSLTTTNHWMSNLQLKLYDISLAGGAAASAFVDLFGTLDEFTTATGSYYQNFFSDAERTARATQLLNAELSALGIDTLPASRAAFRSLVDEADQLGDSELVASLIKLSPAFAQITQEVNALNDAMTGQGLYRTLADATYAATAGGYRQSMEQVVAANNAEMADLLREVVTAIREGDLNNARINSSILAIQQRTDLEPTT
ncbi:phage tail tape measure protein [Roseobacter sp. HKCCD9010]|uniref:phage tail tape measure protein n=1 Tax=unclassified Roseobacter TaxID=196798 RepID=UPI0014925F73|nr:MULTISPECIES: phage tail tape measure protein [unclassified Roseobacter]MBF9050623.1 phage tail tape measure protein [Rhodobacterales bacterium HKCCD4356]NNV11959.1 phage tail tape measure protein [Roseobacter sp. HKCCD7357]NNV16972.1 phage tail tape measure protein [Roseobacter sp. HKCCD8768]NNV26201.1 phage tail tape measure protein [Roseobacter sp. HKCCD8192]NNV30696.1 phage tail tape measure protein [Roseobacter sp. HKCCD9061]